MKKISTLILLLILIGGVWYFVSNNQTEKTEESVNNIEENLSSETKAKWNTYTNSELGFKISYPDSAGVIPFSGKNGPATIFSKELDHDDPQRFPYVSISAWGIDEYGDFNIDREYRRTINGVEGYDVYTPHHAMGYPIHVFETKGNEYVYKIELIPYFEDLIKEENPKELKRVMEDCDIYESIKDDPTGLCLHLSLDKDTYFKIRDSFELLN